MRQRAVVINTSGDGTAEIEVTRSSMCSGCHKAGCDGGCHVTGLFGDNKKMKAQALNKVKAEIGDMVEVESRDSVVLTSAFLVFIMPIIMAGLGYYIASLVTETSGVRIAAMCISFALSFVVIFLTEKIRKASAPDIEIVKIIEKE